MANTTLTYSENGTQVITLPGDLDWTDEFKWAPIVQSQEYAASGSLIIEDWVKQAGRPITLAGGEDRSWTTKTVVLQLQALANLPGKAIVLLLSDGRAFSVIMDHADGSAFDSTQLFKKFPTDNDDVYVINKLKFITTA